MAAGDLPAATGCRPLPPLPAAATAAGRCHRLPAAATAAGGSPLLCRRVVRGATAAFAVGIARRSRVSWQSTQVKAGDGGKRVR